MVDSPSATPPARITVLSGGVGGARFLQGVLRLIERTGASSEVTVIANTGDDIWLHGLKVCPDLDTVMYTLGNGIDTERGWVSLDPTHDREQTEAYVRVAVGRDYADVPPTRGVFRGTAAETLEVAVRIAVQ